MNDRRKFIDRVIMLVMATLMSLLVVACLLLSKENAQLRARLEDEERTEEGEP